MSALEGRMVGKLNRVLSQQGQEGGSERGKEHGLTEEIGLKGLIIHRKEETQQTEAKAASVSV